MLQVISQQLISCLEALAVDEMVCNQLPAVHEISMPLLLQRGSAAASAVQEAARAQLHLQQLHGFLAQCRQVQALQPPFHDLLADTSTATSLLTSLS